MLSGYPALLTLDRRHELRAVIGAPAEEIVYRYGSCDRAATYPSAGRTFRDRFTGGTPALSAADALAGWAAVGLA